MLQYEWHEAFAKEPHSRNEEDIEKILPIFGELRFTQPLKFFQEQDFAELA